MPVEIQTLESRRLCAATFHVSPGGDDALTGDAPDSAWATIQRAFDAATPGATVLVQPGVYREKLTLNVSGNDVDGAIRFVADGAPGEVVISGKQRKGANLIHIAGRSFVSIEGFELRDNSGVRDGSGIRIEGACSDISLLDNRIHRIRGRNAMGITVYGTDPVEGVHDLTIDGNEIFRCQPAPSEALTLNGNVYDFTVTDNYVHDVNNIGIDFIGGEGISPDPATDQARQGVCHGNRVERARSNYGGGFAAGIYVDGGRDILIERNVVRESDLGIEVGCENAGRTAENITVRNNLLAENRRAGLGFGGYAPEVGRVLNCTFRNNTLFHNTSKLRGTARGEIWVMLGSANVVENNLVVGGGKRTWLVNDENDPAATPANQFNFNVYFVDPGTRGATFAFAGETFDAFAGYAAASGHDASSTFADPLLVAPDALPAAGSPAIDAGNPSTVLQVGELDLAGNSRLVGAAVDVGALEVQ